MKKIILFHSENRRWCAWIGVVHERNTRGKNREWHFSHHDKRLQSNVRMEKMPFGFSSGYFLCTVCICVRVFVFCIWPETTTQKQEQHYGQIIAKSAKTDRFIDYIILIGKRSSFCNFARHHFSFRKKRTYYYNWYFCLVLSIQLLFWFWFWFCSFVCLIIAVVVSRSQDKTILRRVFYLLILFSLFSNKNEKQNNFSLI